MVTWGKDNARRVGLLLLSALVAAAAACSDDPVGDEPDAGVDVLADVGADSPDGDDLGADDARDDLSGDLDELDGLDITDAPPDPRAITPRFDPDGVGFYRMPWPSDYRLDESGHPDLSDFPEQSVPAVSIYVGGVQAEVEGFGSVPVVYVALDASIDPTGLPDPADTLDDDSPVRLVRVDPAGCGEAVPIVVSFRAESQLYFDENVLSAVPVPGVSLEPATPYALLVSRQLPTGSDRFLVAPAEMRRVFEATSDDAQLAASFEPLLDCAAQGGGAEIDLDQLAVATVFTTQDPVSELRRVVTFTLDPERVAAPELQSFGPSEGWGRPVYQGTYETPIFQRGQPPYLIEGGGFRFDDEGAPIVQRWESVDFVIAWPQGTTSGELPVLLWEDGSGATVTHFLNDRSWMPEAHANGFAIASFEQPYVGSRAVPGGDPGMTSSTLNPEGARTSPRQQVVDTAYFLRVIEVANAELAALADSPGGSSVPNIDPTRIVYGGQSQGANIGAMTAGVVPGIEAYALNGVGGYLTNTILDRTTEPSIRAIVAAALRVSESQLAADHPVMAVLQLGADATDPINYARYWTGWPGQPDGAHVLLINGFNDPYVPPSSSGPLVIAGRATPLAEPGWEIDPWGVADLAAGEPPVSGNRESLGGRLLTIASILYPSTGHFTVYDRPEVAAATGVFWAGALSGAPIVEVE